MKNLIFILFTFISFNNIICQEIVDSSIVVSQHIIYFDSDKFALTEEHQDSISSLIRTSVKYDSLEWLVKAHTDQIGSLEYNENLSKKRQNSVVDFLLSNGISDSLITSFAYGESLPKSSSNDNLNRRAFIQIAIPKQYLYLKGKIVDRALKLGLNAKIEVKTKDFINEQNTDSLGEFRILAPLDEMVDLAISAKGYFFETNQIQITERLLTKSLTIPLPKIKIGKSFLFKNLNFVGNRSILLPGNDWRLFNLTKFMEINEDICIEIGGHINRPGKDRVKKGSANFELSIARATEIKNHIVQAGVKNNRLIVKGYGNWQMKFPNADTPELMEMNRRVEIKILDCEEAKDLTDDELEDLKRYQVRNYLRTYDDRLYKSDLENIFKSRMTELISQVGMMGTKGIDPEKFTYKEIIEAFPNLPEHKEK